MRTYLPIKLSIRSQFSTWLHKRLGWRVWLLVVMWWELLRSFAGYPEPIVWKWKCFMGGKEAFSFCVAMSRRRWRLEFVPDED